VRSFFLQPESRDREIELNDSAHDTDTELHSLLSGSANSRSGTAISMEG
jgi:hypothetical protein